MTFFYCSFFDHLDRFSESDLGERFVEHSQLFCDDRFDQRHIYIDHLYVPSYFLSMRIPNVTESSTRGIYLSRESLFREWLPEGAFWNPETPASSNKNSKDHLEHACFLLAKMERHFTEH